MACGRSHKAGQHLAGLVVVIVDGLLAQQHQQRLLALDELQEYLCRVERLDAPRRLFTSMARSAPMASAVRSWCLHLGRADGHDDDFLGQAFFPQAQGFFQRDLVEGIDALLDAIGDDAVLSGLTRIRML